MPDIRLPLATPLTFRAASTAKDSRLVNCHIDQTKQKEVYVVKRPGLVINTTVTAGTGLGVYQWLGDLYEVRGTTLYKNAVSLGTVNGTGGKYYFAGTGDQTKLVLKNTTNAYYVSTGGVITAISSVNYPATTVPGIVYLDGYIFVMTPSAQIYNSALEDPTTWSALNFITAETEPDAGVAIVKHMNYVLTLGEWTTEFFYDAANPTGSPLAPVTNAFAKVGCASAGSVVQTDSTVIWMSQTQEKGRQIYLLDGFSPTKVSNEAVERFLDADNLANVYSFAVRIDGRYFYVITLKTSNVTFAYDLILKQWCQWTNGVADGYFEGVAYAFQGSKNIIQDESDGNTYNMSTSVYQDNGVAINTRIVTDRFDGGNNNSKFMSRLQVIGDKAATTIQIRYSNDDYQTFSAYRTVDLSTQRSQLYRLGKFRRRSFEILHTDNTPLRLEAIECAIEAGVN